MTDPVMADHIYLLPLTVESIIKILEEHQIDAVLPTMGGQTALNLAIEAGNQGVWKKYNVQMIGVDLDAIELAENREMFKNHCTSLNLGSAPSKIANSYWGQYYCGTSDDAFRHSLSGNEISSNYFNALDG